MFFTCILFLFLDYIYFKHHGSDCDRAWLLPPLVEPTPEVGLEPYLFERVFLSHLFHKRMVSNAFALFLLYRLARVHTVPDRRSIGVT